MYVKFTEYDALGAWHYFIPLFENSQQLLALQNDLQLLLQNETFNYTLDATPVPENVVNYLVTHDNKYVKVYNGRLKWTENFETFMRKEAMENTYRSFMRDVNQWRKYPDQCLCGPHLRVAITLEDGQKIFVQDQFQSLLFSKMQKIAEEEEVANFAIDFEQKYTWLDLESVPKDRVFNMVDFARALRDEEETNRKSYLINCLLNGKILNYFT